MVLRNLDSLQPFATEHFVVFPYKSEMRESVPLEIQIWKKKSEEENKLVNIIESGAKKGSGLISIRGIGGEGTVRDWIKII